MSGAELHQSSFTSIPAEHDTLIIHTRNRRKSSHNIVLYSNSIQQQQQHHHQQQHSTTMTTTTTTQTPPLPPPTTTTTTTTTDRKQTLKVGDGDVVWLRQCHLGIEGVLALQCDACAANLLTGGFLPGDLLQRHPVSHMCVCVCQQVCSTRETGPQNFPLTCAQQQWPQTPTTGPPGPPTTPVSTSTITPTKNTPLLPPNTDFLLLTAKDFLPSCSVGTFLCFFFPPALLFPPVTQYCQN